MKELPVVLYVIDSLEVGGAELSTINIASELRAFKPIICSIYLGNSLKQLAENKSVELIQLDIPGKYNFIKAYKSLLEIVNETKPAVIVSSLLRSDLLSRLVAKKTGVPLIGTFVSDSYSDYRFQRISLFSKAKVKSFKLLNQLTINTCTHIISNSNAIKKSNCKVLRFSEDKVTVIPRGRESGKYFFEKKFNSEKNIFLNVNRLISTKRVDLLIKAFTQHLQKFPNDELLIAGDGTERATLQNMIDMLGVNSKVKILGKVNDVPSLMQQVDCLVFPSNLEGFSGVLVEALMSGLPILTSDIEMNREAVNHLKNGYIFAVNDFKAIEEALGWFVNNKAAAIAMATEYRKQAHEEYDITNVARQHEKIYKEVIGF